MVPGGTSGLQWSPQALLNHEDLPHITAGSVLILAHLWKELAPINLDWALDNNDEQPGSKDPALRILAEKLVHDGLLCRADGKIPNARAWV